MFRFTIRDVLWVTVVALGVAWWLDNRRQSAKNYYTEMLDWRFRTEALQAHIQSGPLPGKVTFHKEEVFVQDARGYNGYYNRRRALIESNVMPPGAPAQPPSESR